MSPPQPSGLSLADVLPYLGPAIVTAAIGALVGWLGTLFIAPVRLQTAVDVALRTLMDQLQTELARRTAQNADLLAKLVIAEALADSLRGERRQMQQKLDSWERVAAANGWVGPNQ